MNKTIPVTIVGANGYSGEELIRLALRHPQIHLAGATSRQHAGKSISTLFPRFAGLTGSDLEFSAPSIPVLQESEAECFFLALPHGVAAEFAVPLLEAGKRVIDISADFRITSPEIYQEFYQQEHPAPDLLQEAVYGLPEIYGDAIREARLVASPGCYPTSILLPLLPLLRKGMLQTDGIAIASASGTSGAGRKADETLLFAECNESLRAYGIPKHRHLAEIEQELSSAAGRTVQVLFVPHLAPMTRGIHTTIFTRPAAEVDPNEVIETLRKFAADHFFVRYQDKLPDTRQVTGTNFCDLAACPDPRTGACIITSAEDNLIKGAGGQAIQSFNLMFGLPETAGLL